MTDDTGAAFKVFRDLARAQAEDKMFDFWTERWATVAKTGDWTFETQLTPVHRFVITRDPEVVKTILTTKFSQFGKGEDFHRLWSPFMFVSVNLLRGRNKRLMPPPGGTAYSPPMATGGKRADPWSALCLSRTGSVIGPSSITEPENSWPSCLLPGRRWS